MSIFSLCHVDGKTFELRGEKKTINVCRDHGYDERRCLRSEDVRVSIPGVFVVEECPDQRDEYRDCANPVKTILVRPTIYQVDVYERDRDEDRVAMFTKSYTIPACR